MTVGIKAPIRPVSRELFRAAAGQWATGVAVITSVNSKFEPFGLTMTAVLSLSADPQQFLICVDNNSTSLRAILDSRLFCINYLAQNQDNVARVFAGKSPDKFSRLQWSRLSTGLPGVDGALAHIECCVVSVQDGGDHRIIVGEVLAVDVADGEPLMYHRGTFRKLN